MLENALNIGQTEIIDIRRSEENERAVQYCVYMKYITKA